VTETKPIRILVVDDDRNARTLFCKILDRLNYLHRDVGSGNDALSHLEISRDFDLAVIDLFLPDIRGDKLLQKIQDVIPGIKGIILSGYKVDKKDKTLDIPTNAYLHKPFGSQ